MAVFQIVVALVMAALVSACGPDTAKNLTGIHNEEPSPGGASSAVASSAGESPSADASAGASSMASASSTCKDTGSEICDGDDNDCDGAVDEGCECVNGSQHGCGTSLGPCERGTQTCADGAWSDCLGGVQPAPDICDGVDNDCDGVIDPGCDCDEEAQRDCGSDWGACKTGIQSCLHGHWQQCVGATSAAPETCDGIDNDCDGVVDNGFNLAAACPSTGSCPQSRSCSPDGHSTLCKNDQLLFGEERCDGIDNDCDGLVDRVSELGELRSVCTCGSQTLAIGKSTSFALDNDENLCAKTTCNPDQSRHLQVDATCYPVCQTDSDPNQDGWGYEDGASCIFENSARGQAAKPCPGESIPIGMALGYCLDCGGPGNPPFAECQSVPRYDLRSFGRGERWLRVEYSFTSSAAARAPINLWFDAGEKRRKHLPLVRVGDLPISRAKRVLRAEDACFSASEFGSNCVAAASSCPQCGSSERCGALEACGGDDLSQASLEIAAEFCEPGAGKQSGTVTVHHVELIEPQCED